MDIHGVLPSREGHLSLENPILLSSVTQIDVVDHTGDHVADLYYSSFRAGAVTM